jgi:predicted short-subunit dehydrogenase-like oxidoreductase (DUF2520 family)
MRSRSRLAMAVLGAGLAACGQHAETINLAHGHLRLRGSEVTITRTQGPDAQIASGGALRIGGEPVVLAPEQRREVENYYNATVAIREHAIATGKAGAEVGLAAAKEVVSGLAHGDASQIGPRVEAKAEDVKRTALGICRDLEAIRAAQQALVATLAAFRPYAVVEEADVEDCAKDLKSKPAG